MEDKRMISRERGETIAREHGIRFLETSAKANINIDRAFLELAEAILNKVFIIFIYFYLFIPSINSFVSRLHSKLQVKTLPIIPTESTFRDRTLKVVQNVVIYNRFALILNE